MPISALSRRDHRHDPDVQQRAASDPACSENIPPTFNNPKGLFIDRDLYIIGYDELNSSSVQ
jgi:hypothetical protein